MQVWGLNLIDLIIILSFLVILLIIGLLASHGVKKESDFYQGGRTLGKVLQFFLQFGNSTDSTGAVQIASGVYKSGAGGIWEGGLQTLFITPFFWFTQPWWRRARLTTMGDLFVDRFDSKTAACIYAAFSVFGALLNMGLSNLAAYKVCSAMVVVAPADYSDADRATIARFDEYTDLQKKRAAAQLTPKENERLATLESQKARGELRSSISYINAVPFYISYSVIVGIYIIMGGLRAAAITDALQGLLILVMSVILIPIGLHQIHGFHELHLRVADVKKFQALTADMTWYSIAAISLTSFLQVVGLLHNMSTGGSAKDEDTARFGMISGAFTKRIVLIAWTLCGLLALGMLGHLSDPDEAWGSLSKSILPAGLMGLMLSGMLLGHMPSVGVWSVSVAGLATRNVYAALVPGKSERHYLKFAQWSVAGVLIVSIVFAVMSDDVRSVYTTMLTFNAFFGAAVLLLLFWRRLTARAIVIGSVIWICINVLIPWTLPRIESFRQAPALLKMTDAKRPIYFDSIVRIHPTDPDSKLEGIGRFNLEMLVLNTLQVPVHTFSASAFTTVRWLFPGTFPFLLLMVLSWLTPPKDLERSDRFFAKMRTPVAPTPEEDQEQVRLSHENPQRLDHKKMFPRSQWQFRTWTPKDIIGFFGCWLIVGLILGFLWFVLNLGA